MAGAVTLTATVTSANSGNTKTQALTLSVAQNSAIVVDWVKTTVPDGTYGTPYVGQDLTSYVTSTLNGNDVTDKDSYTFTLSAADTANGWYIDTTDHHTLKNDDIRGWCGDINRQ